MFDQVAKKYDLVNTILTGGLVFGWRKNTTAALEIRPGMKILDVAAGTGTSAAQYHAAGAEVTACDFSPGMIEEGKQRYPYLNFEQGDATQLKYADETFDAVTISYGLRNVVDQKAALREFHRVTKPGGVLVIAEFSKPVNRHFNRLYKFFLAQVMPRVSTVFSSDAPAYDYLAESILAWPAQTELGAWIVEAGWKDVEYKNLTNGIVALHRCRKPQ